MSERRRSATVLGRLRHRFRYRFDNLLARGTWAVLLWLGAVTLLAVLLSSLLLTAFGVAFSGSEGSSFFEGFWQSLLRVLDPGTMAGDVGVGRRILALVITIFGILIAGTLIGLIANGVQQRVEAMRRGRSAVVESGHVVILGASTRLPVIVEQLALANRTLRSNAVVVLTDREPVELGEHVRAATDDLYRSRVVIRRGDRARASDLKMVGVHDARAVIVVAEDDAKGDPGVVKAVLATGAELGGFDRVPIVAELSDLETAESLVRACGGAVHPIVPRRSVARITAFALREPGLNRVIEDLIDFRGCDLYVRPLDGLAGRSFGESVFQFAKTRPIGRMRPDGAVEINPGSDTRLEEGDRLIVIADDDLPPEPASSGLSDRASLPATPEARLRAARREEHLLIIGWNALGPPLLAELEEFAEVGSTVEVVYDSGLFDPDELQIPTLQRFDVTLTPSRSATWQLGESAQTSHITSIVLLGYRRGSSDDEGDSRTLLNLMMLRRELATRDGAAPRVIVELLDADDVELARVTGADDYVVSDAITSRLMVQLAEQPQRRAILLSLYAADGPSVHLVGAGELGLTGTVGFDEIIATAYTSGLLAFGWRSGGEVVLNPRSSTQVQLGDADQIVVIG